jgi:hypothetical protein
MGSRLIAMKKSLGLILLMGFLSPCSEVLAKNADAKVEVNDPLHFTDGDVSPADMRVFREAAEDYRAVVEGKRPVHAVVDKNAPLPADGGTTFYIGTGYRLTIQCSVENASGRVVYLYGPIISFDTFGVSGEKTTLSHVEIYSADALRKLRGL